MSVFDDSKKELEAIQAQIEAQEEWFARELDSAKRMIGETPQSARPTAAQAGIPARNYPVTGETRYVPQQPVHQPQPARRPEPAPKKKGIRGLVILAVLELLGILGIAGYWLLYLL